MLDAGGDECARARGMCSGESGDWLGWICTVYMHIAGCGVSYEAFGERW
jgi:hypothetical protein